MSPYGIQKMLSEDLAQLAMELSQVENIRSYAGEFWICFFIFYVYMLIYKFCCCDINQSLSDSEILVLKKTQITMVGIYNAKI
ncbi:hypothetical protein ACSBR2_017628 [Camellia fascicularis]